MCDRRDCGHVGHEPRALRDVAEDDERGLRTDRSSHLFRLDSGRGVRLDPPQCQPALGRNPFQDIAIGREVVGVEDNDMTCGRVSRPR